MLWVCMIWTTIFCDGCIEMSNGFFSLHKLCTGSINLYSSFTFCLQPPLYCKHCIPFSARWFRFHKINDPYLYVVAFTMFLWFTVFVFIHIFFSCTLAPVLLLLMLSLVAIKSVALEIPTCNYLSINFSLVNYLIYILRHGAHIGWSYECGLIPHRSIRVEFLKKIFQSTFKCK